MLVTTIGWLGTVCALLAYLQMANGRWSSASIRYTAFNAASGAAGTVATIYFGAWSSAASNVAWTAIALVSLARLPGERRVNDAVETLLEGAA